MSGNVRLPTVSVIIPVYNVADYVGEALDSVFGQDYPNLEVIVVDDGSSDETRTVLARYADRIHCIHQSNEGAAAARNRGLEQASGDYVTFLDGDDVWLPGKIAAQVAYMERHDTVDMTYGHWSEWRRASDGLFHLPEATCSASARGPAEASDDPLAIVPGESGWLYHRLLTDFLVTTIAVMLRRRLVDRVGGFDTDLARGEDYDYWLRASRVTEIHKLDRVMALYRLHAGSTTFGCPERNYAMEVIERALVRWGKAGPDGAMPDPGELRRHISALWAGYGTKQLRAGRRWGGMKALARSVYAEPLTVWNWKRLAAGAVVACKPRRRGNLRIGMG